jgi:hypothetical protein
MISLVVLLIAIAQKWKNKNINKIKSIKDVKVIKKIKRILIFVID